MKTLRDKVIVITGAGGTIAGPVEAAFAAAGARVVLVDRDPVRIEGRARTYGADIIEADMHTLDDAMAMVEQAKRRTGTVDGLVHLVGDVVGGALAQADTVDYEQAFDTNVRTLFHATRAILPELLEREEAFVGGIAAREAFLGGAAGAGLFAAAKSAVATLLRSLDAELQGSVVDVAVVTPMGLMDTDTNRRALAQQDSDIRFIDPVAIGDALVRAALSGAGGRLSEVLVHPPRR